MHNRAVIPGHVILVAGLTLLIAGLFAHSTESTPRDTVTRSSLSWVRCGGPLGGLGYDVRMHPNDPDTMFVTDAFAGAFRSVDGGETWQPANNGLPATGGMSGDAIKVFCLTIDPIEPNIVWIGLQNTRGIYRSTDAGQTWVEKTQGIPEPEGISFRGITVDPYDSRVVYAAAEISSFVWNGEPLLGYEFDKTQGRVYKSTDFGESWTEIWRGDNLARYIWIDPRDTGVLYVSTGIFDREAANSDTSSNDPGGVGILKSLDGGASWDTVNTGLTNLYVGSLFMHPVDPDILLAGCTNVSYPDSDGVFLTTNGGDSWTRTLDDGATSVEFSLSDPQVAYASNASRVHRSTDGGLTWVKVTPGNDRWGPPGVEAGHPIDLQVDPLLPDRLFANNYGGGNFLSVNGGQTWAVASAGYTGAHVRAIAVAKTDPARVYAAVRSGIFGTYDAGNSWEGLNYEPAFGLEWNAVAVDPDDSFHLLAANNYFRMILASHDGGQTWVDAGAVLPERTGWRCFVFAPSQSQTIYAGTGVFLSPSLFDGQMPAMGVFKSTDGGQTWFDGNDSISQVSQVAAMAVSPQNPQLVYAASTNLGVLKTTDGGAGWDSLNSGLPTDPAALSIAIDPTDLDHVFVGLQSAGLYESTNGGQIWQSVPAGLRAEVSVTSIVFNPQNPDQLYLADLHSGVYGSQDGGVTWTAVNEGLRTRAVNALSLSADGQTLYAATEGEGVFRLDDAGAPSSVGDNPRPPAALVWMQSYPNPFGAAATIAFSLREPAHVSLRIFDAGGQQIRSLLDEQVEAGLHRIDWDGRNDRGQEVPSGVYYSGIRTAEGLATGRVVLAR